MSSQFDDQVAAFRTALNAADTLTKAAILATPEFRPKRRKTLLIGARFSVSGQSCDVQVAYVTKTKPGVATSLTDNTIKGWSPVITLTAGTALKEGLYYDAPDYFLDAAQAIAARLLVITPPGSGTVDLWLGSE